MSEDDLSKACAKVGRFLYEFALVEREIDEGIVKILDLKGGAADVLAGSVDFFRKANLLRTVALETAPDDGGLECVRSQHHGHVEAVRIAMRRLGFDRLIDKKPSRERDLAVAMVAGLYRRRARR